jgi:hypothetical protein
MPKKPPLLRFSFFLLFEYSSSSTGAEATDLVSSKSSLVLLLDFFLDFRDSSSAEATDRDSPRSSSSLLEDLLDLLDSDSAPSRLTSEGSLGGKEISAGSGSVSYEPLLRLDFLDFFPDGVSNSEATSDGADLVGES